MPELLLIVILFPADSISPKGISKELFLVISLTINPANISKPFIIEILTSFSACPFKLMLPTPEIPNKSCCKSSN